MMPSRSWSTSPSPTRAPTTTRRTRRRWPNPCGSCPPRAPLLRRGERLGARRLGLEHRHPPRHAQPGDVRRRRLGERAPRPGSTRPGTAEDAAVEAWRKATVAFCASVAFVGKHAELEALVGAAAVYSDAKYEVSRCSAPIAPMKSRRPSAHEPHERRALVARHQLEIQIGEAGRHRDEADREGTDKLELVRESHLLQFGN